MSFEMKNRFFSGDLVQGKVEVWQLRHIIPILDEFALV